MARGSKERNKAAAPRALDVAAAAGVSTATVSRAFNTPEKVAPEIRDKILKIAADLGWMPHPAGAALASRRTWLVGVLIPTLDHDVFASQVGALQARLAEAGITVLIGCSNYDSAQAEAQLRAMLARGVEALAIVGEAQREGVFDMIRARRVPYVVMYSYRDSAEHPFAGFDNAGAFRSVARHLLDLGHRDFGLIHQPAGDNDRVQARLDGLRGALAENGIALRPQHVHEGAPSLLFGRQGLKAIMETSEPRPTAIVCGNDTLAMGALIEARALGIKVPDELSITGFDDVAMAAHMEPPLTTMRVDNAEIGRRAADYLRACLEDGAPDDPQPVEFHLMLRKSTAAPRSRPVLPDK
ncbi:LacI family DNA-binding transcriptional regulator [Oryzicola mucosus]|uniref:Substrate-binding domain-containing protein n=1 Tax=Oryzicola mucosus TaxID=2767425 RepID=A0A8J6PYS3_9HYPH|nr:substrate-binding domain-containing protein [Oryzicola mucosus]MBD0417038.1 substrate-binding domain-containing protein [Oryzicola mucosus]